MGHPNVCIILFHPVVWIAWRGEIGRGEERRGANYGVKEAPKKKTISASFSVQSFRIGEGLMKGHVLVKKSLFGPFLAEEK